MKIEIEIQFTFNHKMIAIKWDDFNFYSNEFFLFKIFLIWIKQKSSLIAIIFTQKAKWFNQGRLINSKNQRLPRIQFNFQELHFRFFERKKEKKKFPHTWRSGKKRRKMEDCGMKKHRKVGNGKMGSIENGEMGWWRNCGEGGKIFRMLVEWSSFF